MSIPMCDQSTACNSHWHIRHGPNNIERLHRITPDLIQHRQYCHRSTISNVTLKDTPSSKTGTSDYTVQWFYVCIGSRAPHCKTVLHKWQYKTQKASLKKRSIIQCSSGLPQDTKSLRNCSGNQAKMFLKCILESNVTPNIKVIRLLQHSSANR